MPPYLALTRTNITPARERVPPKSGGAGGGTWKTRTADGERPGPTPLVPATVTGATGDSPGGGDGGRGPAGAGAIEPERPARQDRPDDSPQPPCERPRPRAARVHGRGKGVAGDVGHGFGPRGSVGTAESLRVTHSTRTGSRGQRPPAWLMALKTALALFRLAVSPL
jgi:hypothetical protein